jgi:plastocyanin
MKTALPRNIVLKILSFSIAALFLFASSKVEAVTININVISFEFAPKNVTCRVGDTIQWIWQDGDHTTTSVTIPSEAAPWDHVLNSSNTSFKYRVTAAGTYNYKCSPHASMNMTGSFTAAWPLGFNLGQPGKLSFTIYPLPVKDYAILALTITDYAKGQITILNLAGQEMSKKEVDIIPGKNEYVLDLSQFKNGVYFVEMYTGGQNPYTVKIVKL